MCRSADQPAVAYAAEKLFGMSDDEYSTPEERAQDPVAQITLLNNTGVELAKFRRENPGDDLMTSIVNAEVDGHRLTDEEIGAFLILLASAGNDTTKQSTTHAMMALVDNPEQRDWLMEDFENRIGPAVEEFVRWSSPVLQFARFVTEDTEINGHPSRPATRSACSTARPTATKRSSTTRACSTCSAHPTRTSASVAAGRTSAWATSWRRPSCETCSASC